MQHLRSIVYVAFIQRSYQLPRLFKEQRLRTRTPVYKGHGFPRLQMVRRGYDDQTACFPAVSQRGKYPQRLETGRQAKG